MQFSNAFSFFNILSYFSFCQTVSSLFIVLICPPISSKKKDSVVDTCELDPTKPRSSGCMDSDRGQTDNAFRNGCSREEEVEAYDDIPLKKRFENLWVEVEKREIKTSFRNVAGRVEEKVAGLQPFTAKNLIVNKQTEYAPTKEEIRGEEVVCPTDGARSIVRFTIPKLRRSNLENFATESPPESVYEDCMQQKSDHFTYEEFTTSSKKYTTARGDDSIYVKTPPVPDHNTVLQDEVKKVFKKTHVGINWKRNPTNPDKAERDYIKSEDALEEFSKPQPPSLNRCSAYVPGVSDEELEADMERFKLEVGMLKVALLELEKEKPQLQKKVENCLDCFNLLQPSFHLISVRCSFAMF